MRGRVTKYRYNQRNQMAMPISIPKPREDGERGMALTDWRGDEGIRRPLRLPVLGALSKVGLTPAVVSLVLRLYIIPVPILDLGRRT